MGVSSIVRAQPLGNSRNAIQRSARRSCVRKFDLFHRHARRYRRKPQVMCVFPQSQAERSVTSVRGVPGGKLTFLRPERLPSDPWSV